MHALHENTLPFINGGQHVTAIPEVSTPLSLILILGILTVTTIASLLKSRSDARRELDAGSRTDA